MKGCNKQRNSSVSILHNARKNYCPKLKVPKINDNKAYQETIKTVTLNKKNTILN